VYELTNKADYISQGSVETRLGFDAIFNDQLLASLLRSILVKEFRKLASI